MIKTKKNYIILAIITALAMLFGGISALFGVVRTNSANNVFADETELAGTWVFDEEPDVSNFDCEFRVDFKVGNDGYQGIEIWSSGVIVYIIDWETYTNSGEKGASFRYAYYADEGYAEDDLGDDCELGWQDNVYKTIVFDENEDTVAYVWDVNERGYVLDDYIDFVGLLSLLATKQAVTPETGVVLDIILPSVVIGLTLLATVVIWKKKEQY